MVRRIDTLTGDLFALLPRAAEQAPGSQNYCAEVAHLVSEALALEAACETHVLTHWLAEKRGGQLLVGKAALDAEIGKLERARDEAGKRIRQLKHVMGELE